MIENMLQWLRNRDLLIRLFVVLLVSLVILSITKNNQFDLHFKLRKNQAISPKVQIIEFDLDADLPKLIHQLQEKKVKHVYVNHFYWDKKNDFVTPYAINDRITEMLCLEFKPDSDGIVRRFVATKNPPHPFITWPENATTINFRGPSLTFPSLKSDDALSATVTTLNDKIVILSQSETTGITTPLGLISEPELLATLIDNHIENRFIPDGKTSLQVLVIIVTLLISVTLLLYLPSTLALLATFVFAIFYVSLSLWLFDNLILWTPIINPLIQMILTFLLITNYKHVLDEQTKWKLERESIFFQEVEEMKTNFLSLFSHDLKTPLAKIMGLADTLQSKNLDSETQKDLEKITQSSKDLEKAIQRILKMSQMQSKNMSLNKHPEDINHLIEKALEQNKYHALKKDIQIQKNLQPLFMIDIDGALIQEVITNFIENAITYSPPKSIIQILSEENDDYIRVSVQDQGPGIPKAVQDQIWEKYYRFDSEKSGYGLGLFLSRYVIQLHGGKVFLNSRVNHGSEFGFILPINEGKT